MRLFILLCYLAVIFPLSVKPGLAADEDIITVFVPSVPGIEKLLSENGGEARAKGQKSIWRDDTIPEADILMTLMQPNAYLAHGMDMPQSFAVLFQPDKAEGGEENPVRKDLLGDVEEIRYLDTKAWGANVALADPGLYQFIMEGKPFWNERKDEYYQQSAKLYLPVLSDGRGWDRSAGQGLEIVPLTRPYGLQEPALFTAKVLFNGKAVNEAEVIAGRLNVNKKAAPTRWHGKLETRTDQAGVFSVILNSPGWWYCEAVIKGEPLKGADGQMKDVRKSSIIWLYVESSS